MRLMGKLIKRWFWTCSLLSLAACSAEREPTPGTQRDCSQRLFFTPAPGVSTVTVAGDFNDWDTEATQLLDHDGDGTYSVLVQAPAGSYTYRIYAGGQSFLDPFNPLTLFDAAGQENSVLHIANCAQPAFESVELKTNAAGDFELGLRFLRATTGSALEPKTLRASLEDGQVFSVNFVASSGEIQIGAQGLATGKHRLTVTARDRQGAEAESFILPFWIEPRPFSWQDAVIYQVMVDRFGKGGGSLSTTASISHYHGGDLAGIIEAIEAGYFQRMGAKVLWLSPANENPEGEFIGRDGHLAEAYHGYWPSAARAVESRFGGAHALEALIDSAHRHGLRVIIDAVLNHIHQEHPYAERGPSWFNHPEGDCICGFSCSWAGHMEQCWFDPFLPDLSFHNEAVVAQMTADATWWIERFDLDGLRIDAVPMMPRLAIRHLRDRIQKRLATGTEPVFLLGETYTGQGGQDILRWYLGPHSLSGQFDYPVMWALRAALAERIPLSDLDAEVKASQRAWQGSGAVMAPILGSHDVSRFVSDVNGDPVYQPRDNPPPPPSRDKPYQLLQMAWTFLLTQPGAPVIYYGDEFGMPGGYDPDNRRNMRFGDQLSAREQAVWQQVARLGQARDCSLALRRGERETLLVHDNLYVYGRDAADGYPAVVALNRATVARELTLALPADWDLAAEAQFVDVLGAPAQTDGRNIHVTVPPRGSVLLLAEAACTEVLP